MPDVSRYHCTYSKKDFSITVDNSIDSLEDFSIGLLVDEDAMTVSRMIKQGHQNLEIPDLRSSSSIKIPVSVPKS